MERHPDVEALLAEEARELLVARKRGAVVHRTGDFDTAGAEFEAGFRAWLTRRLPIAYKVSHGHLVDTNRVSSPQLDVIVADGLSSLTLFTAADGTEYLPIDSAFAVGELKSRYRSRPSRTTI